MKLWINTIVVAVTVLAVSSQTCPSDHFSAVFAATVEQRTDTPHVFFNDPELVFFKTIMKFRDEAIEHAFDDAIAFFNDTFGLDFSGIAPNERYERFLGNAILNTYIIADDIEYYVTANRWIQTGSTRSACYRIRDGGIRVVFSGEQTLYGSYGGAEGRSAVRGTTLAYGFYNIDVCQQSPLIIQYRSRTPIRIEPIDSVFIYTYDLYSNVLGYGKAQGIATMSPDPDEPEKYRFINIKTVFTFPA